MVMEGDLQDKVTPIKANSSIASSFGMGIPSNGSLELIFTLIMPLSFHSIPILPPSPPPILDLDPGGHGILDSLPALVMWSLRRWLHSVRGGIPRYVALAWRHMVACALCSSSRLLVLVAAW